jgi:putative hemolysin
MIAAYVCATVLLLAIYTVASYADRVYSEMGKFLSRESEENVEVWERGVEPRLGMSRARAALSAAVLEQLSLGLLALLFGAMLLDRAAAWGRPTGAEIVQAVLGLVLAVVVCGRLAPAVLFARTRGQWIAGGAWVLRGLFLLISPVTLACSFLLSIAALAEPPAVKRTEEEHAAEAVDALLEAGEEEGILEESDRELLRSAVEFGDKIVREVMTPRPSIFAVEARATLEELLCMLQDRAYSRIPVYAGTLDDVTGIVFAHDLLQIPDEEAGRRTVASLERPAAFVPEMKRVNELLREMQREKQHMRIVIDEYGGVSGLVTIEDLLEEIVGEITDEHEGDLDAPVEEAAGVWVLPGALELAEMERLSPEFQLAEDGHEATTVGGLVSEIAGRIPMPGEVVVDGPVRFEVLASTDRRIERLRVSPAEAGAGEQAGASPAA